MATVLRTPVFSLNLLLEGKCFIFPYSRAAQSESTTDHCAQGAGATTLCRQLPAVRYDLRKLPEAARLLHQGDNVPEASSGCDGRTALFPPFVMHSLNISCCISFAPSLPGFSWKRHFLGRGEVTEGAALWP